MLWLCPGFRFHLCLPTIFLSRLPTIHEFILLGLVVIGRAGVIKCPSVFGRNILPWLPEGESNPWTFGRECCNPSAETQVRRAQLPGCQQDRICSELLPAPWSNCVADLPSAVSPWLFPNSSCWKRCRKMLQK